MKKKPILLLLVAVLFLIGISVQTTVASAATSAAHFNHFQVVDLSADATENGQIIDVSGGIKNQSFSSVRGHAILYLIDQNNNVVHAVETEVNDQQRFQHGQTGTFSVTIDISALNNLQSVSVEFVQHSPTAI